MKIYPLKFIKQHLFITLDGKDWLIDTGSPVTFGDIDSIELMGQSFQVGNGAKGLNASAISGYVGMEVAGLIGANILNQFDLVFDIAHGELTFVDVDLELPGIVLELDECMGIPIVESVIAGNTFRMFFDTGAQISYLQDDCLSSFEHAGKCVDFYHGYGDFETDTYLIDCKLDGSSFNLRCGSLPETLGASLMMANTTGIIGNEIMIDKVVGYFPKSGKMVISA
ncbi:hypothetical protein [Thalassotalea crassostreae]|uniref:hypothetical protein n=1 Tax=Thalassotalea crassostreae TaxID=1763536 RepID=UPI000839A82F|nr:hypothetical protein [Thalassotalea crassostreae]